MGRRVVGDLPWADHETGVAYRYGVVNPAATFWRAFDSGTIYGRYTMSRAWKPITRVLPTTSNVMLYADFRNEEVAEDADDGVDDL